MVDPDRDKRVDTRLRRAIEARQLPRELLCVGPAGTGKTFGILAILHLLAADYPGLRILFCRKTRTSLTESVLDTFEREVLPRDGMESVAAGVRRNHRSNYVYPNGSMIVLAGTDEPTRIGSTTWDIIYPNEAIELEEDMWETLGSRLNRPGSDPRFGFLIADTNPGDPSHWLKKRCDDGRTSLWDTSHKANPAMWTGRDWTPKGKVYLEQLDRLRGTRRKRLLEGVWAAGEGQWFETFGAQHVSDRAEYDPRLQVWLAVDSGVHTGAVWFQIRDIKPEPLINVFGDYYVYNIYPHEVAQQILTRTRALCGGRIDRGVTDPAGGALNPSGPIVISEYARAGLRLEPWPRNSSVAGGLALIESFVSCDPPGLTVHPRCQHLITAFGNYKRAKRGGQYLDRPEDPQHPHEELMDSLRGGLIARWPEGRKPEPEFRWAPARGGRFR